MSVVVASALPIASSPRAAAAGRHPRAARLPAPLAANLASKYLPPKRRRLMARRGASFAAATPPTAADDGRSPRVTRPFSPSRARSPAPSPSRAPSLATRVAAAARRALASLALLVGLALGALVPSAAARDGTPTAPRHHVHYHSGFPTASATAAHIIGRAPAVDYSAGLANIPIATGDVGSMGGLTPDNWGLPYKGKNPAMALFMASAGVTLRMAVNVAVIYCIYTYWLNDGPDSS